MEKRSNEPTAFEVTKKTDEALERLLLYLGQSQEPLHAATLGMVIADLKEIKRLVILLDDDNMLQRASSLKLCNQLFLRILRSLKKTNRYFPF